jgi:MoaA/NifB/PqqE/SkfB family radical SAM enzyme
MKSHIKLEEIIWEITDNCEAGCTYCGSKDSLNKTKIDKESIASIVDAIYDYPPKEISISGGNPLIVPYISHEHLINKLEQKDVVCKILINPYNICTYNTCSMDDSQSVLELYDWIGVSINTLAELKRFKTTKCFKSLIYKCTIISNFNIKNIFQFKKIEEFVLANNLTWQIQYTMYEDEDKSENAVYQNEEAQKLLMQYVYTSKATIICADNMNSGPCTAGLKSIGILANGDIVPCLSMRSYYRELPIIGNILQKSLEDNWVYNFSEFRCKEFVCCKDITKCMETPINRQDLIDRIKLSEPSLPVRTEPIPTFVYAVIKSKTNPHIP